MNCFVCGGEIVTSAWAAMTLNGINTFQERIAQELAGKPYHIVVCTLCVERPPHAHVAVRIVETDCVEKAKEMGYVIDKKRKPPRR